MNYDNNTCQSGCRVGELAASLPDNFLFKPSISAKYEKLANVRWPTKRNQIGKQLLLLRHQKSYHSPPASVGHQEVCKMCFQFEEEVCVDDYAPVPVTLGH